MKKNKGSGRSIIATARKLAVIIWNMLTEGVAFDEKKMVDKKLAKKAEAMRKSSGVVEEPLVDEEEKAEAKEDKKKSEGVKKTVKKTGVARRKIKKVG